MLAPRTRYRLRIPVSTQMTRILSWIGFVDSPIAARLKTGQRQPQMPKEALFTTGNPTWYTAPMRPVKQTKKAAIEYPSQTHIHDCHHDRPLTIMEELIIQVLMLNESAIQNPT